MSVAGIVRKRMVLAQRTFTVLGDAWFDRAVVEWRARVVFVPLDRSLPRPVASAPLRRGRRRDDVVRQLDALSDADLAKAFRTVALPQPRRVSARERP